MSGQVATGKNYFPRPKEEAKVWRYLERGAHLILLAPRRFGKTSLLRSLEKTPKEGYVFLYCMVQSCETEHDFYKRILEQLYDTDFVGNLHKATQKSKDFITNAIRSIDKITVGDTGIKLKQNGLSISHNDLITVIKSLSLEQKMVIVLDEYPDVVEKISLQQGHEAVKRFLSHTRELCQDTQLNRHVQFIFTGSIGLDTLANRLQLSNLINDREKLSLSPLTTTQATDFITFITKKNKSSMIFNNEVINYLLKKVEWLILYYIEILWERLEDYCEEMDITHPKTHDVDKAYEKLFSIESRPCFNHWAERLQRLEKNEQQFAKELLGHTATKGQITLTQYLNVCEEFNTVNTNYVMDCLEHDGYLFESEPTVYQFTSPILKDWWNRYANRTL